mgnify:CR=1 FL=1
MLGPSIPQAELYAHWVEASNLADEGDTDVMQQIHDLLEETNEQLEKNLRNPAPPSMAETLASGYVLYERLQKKQEASA